MYNGTLLLLDAIQMLDLSWTNTTMEGDINKDIHHHINNHHPSEGEQKKKKRENKKKIKNNNKNEK